MKKISYIILLIILVLIGASAFAQDKPDAIKGNLIFKPTTGYGADTAFAYIIKNSNTAGQSGFIGILGTDTMYLTISSDSIRLFGTKPFAGGYSSWSLTGNAGTDTATNFIGTTDEMPLRFKSGGISIGQLDWNRSNISFGVNSLNPYTTGGSNNSIGLNSMFLNIDGSENNSLGTNSLYNNQGNNNIAIGADAGRYQTTLKNRIYLNTKNRTNLAGDTTLSPIYINDSASVAQIYLNGNTYIKNNATISNGNNLYIKDSSGNDTTSIYDNETNTIIDSDNPIIIHPSLTSSLISRIGGFPSTTNIMFNNANRPVLSLIQTNSSGADLQLLHHTGAALGNDIEIGSVTYYGSILSTGVSSVLAGGLFFKTAQAWNSTTNRGSYAYIATSLNGSSSTNYRRFLIQNDGKIGFSSSAVNALTTPNYNLSFEGSEAKTIGVEAHGTTTSAGSNLSINAGGTGATANRQNGGMLTLSSGISTGAGFSSIRLQRNSRLPVGTTPTTANSLSDAVIVFSEKNLVDNTNDTICSISIVATQTDSSIVARFVYGVTGTNDTDIQAENGAIDLVGVVKDGVAVVSNTPVFSQAVSTGTLTGTWTLTWNNTAKLFYVIVKYDSSLNPTAGKMKLMGTLFNNCRGAVVQF